MRTVFNETPDNFKTKDYPQRKLGQKRNVVFWTNSKEGRFYKAVVGAYGDMLKNGTSVGRTREFPERKDFCRHIRELVPLDEWYKEQSNGFLPSDGAIADRYHKQYYDNSAPREFRGKISKEHYTVADKLRAYVTLAERVVGKGRPISRNWLKQELDQIVDKTLEESTDGVESEPRTLDLLSLR
jgi:hypothetical protein